MRVVIRLLGFLGRFPGRMLLSSGMAAVAVGSNIGLLAIAGYLLAATAQNQALVLLTLPIYTVRLLAVVRAAARYAERLTGHDVTLRILLRFRLWIFDRLVLLGPLTPLCFHSGDALRRFVADVDELQQLYLRSLSPLTVALLIAGLVAVVLHGISPTLTWIILAYLAVAGIVMPVALAVAMKGIGRTQTARRAELATAVVDGIQGLQDLLTGGRGEDFMARVSRLDRGLASIERRVGLVSAVRVGGGDLLANLAMWTALAVLIPLVQHGDAPGSALPVVAFLTAATFEITQPLALALQSLDHTRASGARIFAITDARPAVSSPPNPMPLPASLARHPGAAPPALTAAYELVFDHVTLAYGPDEAPALADVTLSLLPGKRVAVVGPSGAGKSTLARLALRMVDPTRGAVLLGGRDLRAYSLDDVRSVITLVAQDSHIFNRTVRGNLLLGDPAATEVELWDALEAARLAEAVQRMPGGLDTWVGEHGLLLAGGERQRLAIARALLRDAPILMLDEPTANLDAVTEGEVLAALDTLLAGRTTLWITHRLIEMERMDEILVLDRGRIVERGTHGELSSRPGLYRRMLDIQDGLVPWD